MAAPVGERAGQAEGLIPAPSHEVLGDVDARLPGLQRLVQELGILAERLVQLTRQVVGHAARRSVHVALRHLGLPVLGATGGRFVIAHQPVGVVRQAAKEPAHPLGDNEIDRLRLHVATGSGFDGHDAHARLAGGEWREEAEGHHDPFHRLE